MNAYAELVAIFMFQAGLKWLEIDVIPLLLVQLLDMLRVVFADVVVTKVGCYDPDGAFAVHSRVLTAIFVVSYASLAYESLLEGLLTTLHNQKQHVPDSLISFVELA
jgi:hypothetical protein